MIIITGRIITNSENRSAIEAEAVVHCRRSRAEPGCIAHNCHWDAEHPERLVFVEKWADAKALLIHFAVPESGEFVKAVSALSTEPPIIEIYVAEQTSPAALSSI